MADPKVLARPHPSCKRNIINNNIFILNLFAFVLTMNNSSNNDIITEYSINTFFFKVSLILLYVFDNIDNELNNIIIIINK